MGPHSKSDTYKYIHKYILSVFLNLLCMKFNGSNPLVKIWITIIYVNGMNSWLI